MNKTEAVFIDILKASLAGATAPALPELSNDERTLLIDLASSHKVLPLVYEASHTQLANPFLRSKVRQQVMLQTMKSHEFLELYRKLLDADVHPIVVKGIVCRNLYPHPDHRVSADEDILVHPNEFDKACRVLEDFGMSTVENSSDAYEYPYRKNSSPLYIELHKYLFPPENDAYGQWNSLFAHVFDHTHIEMVQNIPVYTLEPTDHLLYLLLHALKHFMHSGFGIRQVCDIAVFAKHWNDTIQWERLLCACERVHGAYFAAAVFQIGQVYLGIDIKLPDQWQSLSVDAEDMLLDLLAGGIYGGSSLSRMHSSNITLEAVASNNQKGRKSVSILRTIFLPIRKMEARFPYLKKHPWLLPVAWVQRVLRYWKELRSDSSQNALESVQIGARRVELLYQYGVIK